MKKTFLFFSILINCSMISYCQSIEGEYFGSYGKTNEKLTVKKDSTFGLICQIGDIDFNIKGKWSLINDTLILNPFTMPNDSVIHINSYLDSTRNNLYLKTIDLDGFPFIPNNVNIYDGGIKMQYQNPNLYADNYFQCIKFDSLEFASGFSSTKHVIKPFEKNNSFEVVIKRAIRLDEVYNQIYIIQGRKLISQRMKGLILKK